MLTLSPEANIQLKKLLAEENDPDLGLRVFVAGGGCSGFQYNMILENEIRDGDEITEVEGVKVYVDQFSTKYLNGAQIDFVNSLMGGGFQVKNPNAVASCACGTSFDPGDGAATARACGK